MIFAPLEYLDSEDEIDAKAGPDWGGKTCSRCGVSGLHWEQDRGRWQLADYKGMHVCTPRRSSTTTTDGAKR